MFVANGTTPVVVGCEAWDNQCIVLMTVQTPVGDPAAVGMARVVANNPNAASFTIASVGNDALTYHWLMIRATAHA